MRHRLSLAPRVAGGANSTVCLKSVCRLIGAVCDIGCSRRIGDGLARQRARCGDGPEVRQFGDRTARDARLRGWPRTAVGTGPQGGSVAGGLGELVQRFEQNGLGDVVQSWIGNGPNQPVSPDQLHQAIGPQTMDRLAQQSGMSKSALLPLLAQALPAIVDRLTPNQRLPQQNEIQSGSNDTVEV